jgi:cardiolipin synthase
VSAHFLGGNRITLLRSGTEYFPALLAAIRAAKAEIFLETYIYAGDGTGQRVTQALCDAAARGAAVRVLVDGFGSKDMSKRIRQQLLGAGVKFLVYRPKISPWTLRRDRLRRMHRKLAVVDGRIAFVGGINVIDDLDAPHQVPPRYDYAVRVEGPLLGPIHDAVVRLWNRTAWRRMQGGLRIAHRASPDGAHKGDQRAAFVVRDNFGHRRDIEQAYLAAIASAREEIVIACAYFFPGTRFRRALAAAAARGVRVVLLLQGRVEYVWLHYASRALYGTLLDSGIEIHEYHRSFLHAKVAVIDGHWATVGSSNIDAFSLLLAREANVVVEDRAFAAALRNALSEAMQRGATAVPKRRWFALPLRKKLPIWIAYGIARFAIGMVGFNGRF